MKTTLLSFMLLLSVSTIFAQNQIQYYTLETITDSALKHFAIKGQTAINRKIFELKSAKIDNAWKPQLMLNAQLSYQSDVTKIEVPLPGFDAPEIDKDWYKFNLDITQQIYDGGISGETKKIEEANLAISIKNIENQEFHFREQIHKIYYQALLFDQQIRLQQSAIYSLDTLIGEMQAAFELGMFLQSDLNTIKVEQLKLMQQLTMSKAARKSALAMLATYSNLPIAPGDSLIVPQQQNKEILLTNHRPELELFALQQQLLHQQELLTKATRSPKIQAFGQAGYGRPGYNMLDDSFTPYAMAGIRLQYKLFDWKTNQKERQIIRLNASNIDLAIQDFEQNISAAAQAKLEEIKQYEALLNQGDKIIQLQKEILQTSESKLKIGAVTASNYITELEKYQQSLLNQQSNKLQLQMAINTFNFITGNIKTNETH